jgi:asparagine synthase (glutamine-hydrolysing)
MCGIAGYFGSKLIDDDRARACLKLMRRRGPDATGTYRSDPQSGRQLLLLHSRLSIIDLDRRANQPFHTEKSVLAYNGELYNYIEIRRQLKEQGHQFHTQSDTEVLARALLEDGTAALDRCEGMWAFAYFDVPSGSLLLSRDRFGEKPLYVYRTDDGLYFASEPKFLFALLGHALKVNYTHLTRYMVNGYKSLYKGGDTFFDGLEELAAGSCLRIESSGHEQSERYWEPRCEQIDSMTYDQAVEGTRQRLIESVRLRLRADVPLAFCMSGGVDSNSLICTAKRELGYDVHGFTIVNQDARYEEQDEVEHVVRELGLRHTTVPVSTDNFLERLCELVSYHDAPVYTITYFAHWTLMRHVAERGYKISISGTAADELFTGYFDHHLFYLSRVAEDPDLFERSLTAWRKYIAPTVRNPLLQDPQRFVENPAFRDHIYLHNNEFAGYLQGEWQEEFYEASYSSDVLRNRMLNELFHEATPVILHEDDLNAMYFSIENRSPFLDRSLFEFANSIPTRHLIRNGAAKSVLRDAMRGIVPDRILDNRHKVGFNAPLFSYLDPRDPKVQSYLLDDSPIYEHVRREKIQSLLNKQELPNSESKFLFYFLNSKIFLEQLSA